MSLRMPGSWGLGEFHSSFWSLLFSLLLLIIDYAYSKTSVQSSWSFLAENGGRGSWGCRLWACTAKAAEKRESGMKFGIWAKPPVPSHTAVPPINNLQPLTLFLQTHLQPTAQNKQKEYLSYKSFCLLMIRQTSLRQTTTTSLSFKWLIKRASFSLLNYLFFLPRIQCLVFKNKYAYHYATKKTLCRPSLLKQVQIAEGWMPA